MTLHNWGQLTSNNIESKNSWKESYSISRTEFERNHGFRARTEEPRNQFKYVLPGIRQKRTVNCKKVVYHYDNTRPRASMITRQKLLDLWLDVLLHPTYSSDLTLSDFHLFYSLKNSLRDTTGLSTNVELWMLMKDG